MKDNRIDIGQSLKKEEERRRIEARQRGERWTWRHPFNWFLSFYLTFFHYLIKEWTSLRYRLIWLQQRWRRSRGYKLGIILARHGIIRLIRKGFTTWRWFIYAPSVSTSMWVRPNWKGTGRYANWLIHQEMKYTEMILENSPFRCSK